jgi:hemoglobin
MSQTLFERYGGFAKISRIVSDFYDKVLESPILSPYFQETDMKRQIDHQTKFVASLMGGPASYTNEELERLHARFKIDDRAFSEMASLLRETLEDFGLDDYDVDTIIDGISSRKRFIVSQG